MAKINNKGASIIVGYVLLVTFGLVMSGIAYSYLKTYVPSEIVNCPSDSSLFIKEYTCSGDILNITLENNGRFNLDGFIIYSSNDTNDEIATDNLQKNFIIDAKGISKLFGNDPTYIKFDMTISENGFKPSEENSFLFNLTNSTPPITNIKFIEITPTIIKVKERTVNLALCPDAKINQKIICSS